MAGSRRHFQSIDEYIGTFPENVQSVLNQLRQTIKEAAPEAEETINYQMPTFTLNGNLVHFAAFKDHIGFYPTPSGIKHSRENWLLINRPRARFNFQSTSRSRCP